jgi:GT2 family glycosyltransferase
VPLITVIVVNWNTRELLAECLRSIERTAGDLDLETIVVDNASTDGSLEMVHEQFPLVRLMANPDNLGFSRANNEALAVGRGRYLLLLNSDAVLTPGALQVLLALAEAQPRAGIVGARLLNPDGSFQASHTPFPTLWQEFLILSGLGRLVYGRWYPSRGPEADKGPQRVDYVEGACLLVRREAVREVGGLDDGYFMYAEEVDWCYTMRRVDWEVWYHPEAVVVHHGGASSRGRRTRREADLYRSRVRFFRKYYGDRPAATLKALMVALTAVKIIMHGALRFATGGRAGRPVVSLQELRAALSGV